VTEQFRTVAGRGRARFEVRGSEFVGHVAPVRSLPESAGAEFEADDGAEVRFDVRVPADEAADLRDRVRSATSGRARLAGGFEA